MVVAPLLLLAGGLLAWTYGHAAERPTPAPPRDAAPGGVPVVAVAARQGDLPVYLEGLGTVTAYNTTTVRSRIDGTLEKVAFAEGQAVHQGDLLAVVDERPYQAALAQAKATLAKDVATTKSARADLAEYVAARAALPAQQLEHAQATVDESEATVRVDRAEVATAALNRSYCEIRSPIDGIVGLRLVDVGNVVHAADTTGLAVLTQVKPIAVVFTVPQEQLTAARQAQLAGSPATEVFDRDFNRSLGKGVLVAIDNQIDTATGTVRLKARLDNQDGALFPNQFVNVRLLVSTLHGVVLVPTAAIQRGADGSLVYVVGPDHTVAVRHVTLGAQQGDTTVIEQGVAAGELVVSAGVDKLQQGTRVVVSPPPAAARRSPSSDGRTS